MSRIERLVGCFKSKNKEKVEIKNQSGKDEKRDKWGSQLEFWLSVLGWIVGPGNLWRFPYLCMRNGGGAFLIPYVIFLVLCAIPLMFLEISTAQYSSQGFLGIWNVCPLFKGVGYATILVVTVCSIYWILILTWVIYFFISSFASQLPWASCDNWWNTPNCTVTTSLGDRVIGQNTTLALEDTTYLYTNQTVSYESLLNMTGASLLSNSTTKSLRAQTSTSVEEFWRYNVLEISSGIGELGYIRWQLLLCHMAAWIIIFLCIVKGIKSSGKVVYVTATLPYILLTVLLVRGAMLKGSMKGIVYYLYPDFSKLKKPEVWGEACVQIFYSMGICWGSLMTMGSYNDFHYNCCRDSILLTICSAMTSFFAGFVIFSVMGFLSEELQKPVSEVIKPGPGLAFMAYPEALSKLPAAPVWAVLFFIMFFTAGVDGQFPMVESIVTSITDGFPRLVRRRSLVSAIVCGSCFLIGLPIITQGGVYIFSLCDWYLAVFTILVIGLIECIVLGWVYGADRLYDNLEKMLGVRPSLWWKICWKFLSPALVTAILVFNILMLRPVTYGSYNYPKWAIGIGYVIAIGPMLPIPGFMIYQILQTPGTLRERLRILLSPSPLWGSAVTGTESSGVPMVEQKFGAHNTYEDGHVVLAPVEQSPFLPSRTDFKASHAC